MLSELKSRIRPLYTSVFERSASARMLYLLASRRTTRDTAFVRNGYNVSWSQYREHLDGCSTVDDWLCIRGVDDKPSTHVFEGVVQHASFDSNRFWIDQIEQTIRHHFPHARSITEYGCGVGRNLIAIKRRFPDMACFGYELASPGVEVARAAARKFGFDVTYSQLDYVKDSADRWIHPSTDLALTVFSLEQIPHVSPVAVKNMLDRSALGSIHIEPVCENYPINYRGLLGRMYTKRADYLQNFDSSVRALPIQAVHVRVLDSSHNPLIPNPSLYVLVR